MINDTASNFLKYKLSNTARLVWSSENNWISAVCCNCFGAKPLSVNNSSEGAFSLLSFLEANYSRLEHCIRIEYGAKFGRCCGMEGVDIVGN